MRQKFKNFLCGAVTFSIACAVTMARIPSANAMSMDELRAEFFKKTNKKWEEATSAEKRAFVRKQYRIPEEPPKEAVVYRALPGITNDALASETTLVTRRLYRQVTNKSWDEASAKEQNDFLKQYGERIRQEAQLEAIRIQQEKQQEEIEKRNKEMERQREQQEARAKLMQEQMEEQQRQREREERLRKLQDKLDNLSEQHRKTGH